MNPIWKATITAGKLKIQHRDNFIDYISEYEGKVVEVIVRESKSIRSLNQNDLYWAMLEIVSDHTGYTKDELHEEFRHKFLSDKMKVIGEAFIYSRSTTSLKTDEMSRYLADIKFFCFHELGLTLPIE